VQYRDESFTKKYFASTGLSQNREVGAGAAKGGPTSLTHYDID